MGTNDHFDLVDESLAFRLKLTISIDSENMGVPLRLRC